jgi:hypothetical protein
MSTAPARQNRNWIVFFLMLALLAAVGIVVPLWYNLSLQLNAGEVAAAKERWREKGPADYDMEYRSKIDTDEPVEYRVAVRNRRAVFVATRQGHILEIAAELRAAVGAAVGCPVDWCAEKVVPTEELTRRHTIDAFFALIESKLGDDVAVGGRNYATATFDSQYGYPLRYIHRVRNSPERIELNAHLLPPDSPYDPE